MKTLRFTRTLHFRMSALFLLLLGLSVGGYYLWINATVFKTYQNRDEEIWFEDQAETELAALADSLAGIFERGPALGLVLADYGRRVAPFNVEVILFDPRGLNITSTRPDSLAMAVKHVDPLLLQDMTTEGWDFSSYPLPGDIDAYENRIFEVVPLASGAGDQDPPLAYLAASFQPLTIGIDELDADWRSLGFRALVLMLIYTAVTAMIIMAWASRRIRGLTRGVAALAEGNFGHRVPDRSGDEIGALGRHFNAMAGRLQGMMDELSGKEQFQRQLIANVSHDLRTPLASLRGYIETLSLDPENLTPSERQRYLEIITGNLDHLDQLLERTLILSRLDSGQAPFRKEDFPLGELVDSVLVRCRALADRKGVELDQEIPADPQGFLVHADALQIGQVLQNLVENGIKFNRAGGRVLVRATLENRRVRVTVHDDGPGIPPEDIPFIFDRFFTGDRSRTRLVQGDVPTPSSSGLGLAIADKIISGHGGALTVSCDPGQGTVFSFSLPASLQGPGEARRAES